VIAGLREVSAAALVAVLLVAPALGQPERSWVDPPVSAQGAAQAPADAPENEVADVGTTGAAPAIQPSREQAARQLAVDYLDFWSSPNALTLEVMPRFYAERVDFHGRSMSTEAVVAEKRRFVRRWPVRSYTARIDTLRASCAPAAQTCTVKGRFDFTAISPERGRRSQGAADLELQVSFAGERPTILAETSRIVPRGRTRAGATLDEIED
jgi:hypothetical protein